MARWDQAADGIQSNHRGLRRPSRASPSYQAARRVPRPRHSLHSTLVKALRLQGPALLVLRKSRRSQRTRLRCDSKTFSDRNGLGGKPAPITPRSSSCLHLPSFLFVAFCKIIPPSRIFLAEIFSCAFV